MAVVSVRHAGPMKMCSPRWERALARQRLDGLPERLAIANVEAPDGVCAMLIVIGPWCVRPRCVRAYVITLRISDATARCFAGWFHMPRTVQHLARPDGSSPGGRCGVAAGRGSGADASTSTSTVTGIETLTGSLTSSVGRPGYSSRSTRKSCVVHSAPSWRVVTNAARLSRLTQNSISTIALVWTVRAAAPALNAPPRVMTTTRPPMMTRFMLQDEAERLEDEADVGTAVGDVSCSNSFALAPGYAGR